MDKGSLERSTRRSAQEKKFACLGLVSVSSNGKCSGRPTSTKHGHRCDSRRTDKFVVANWCQRQQAIQRHGTKGVERVDDRWREDIH